MKLSPTLLFLLFFIAGIQAQEKRIALIIGNATYTQGALRNPVNDANLMETTLKGLGFEVIKTTNATKLRMEQVVRQFSEKLGNYNVALFFYAGHGMQANGVNYLIPVDAKLAKESDLKYEAISVNFVVEEFENYPNNTNIVILDACRDNPLASWARSGARGFKAIQPKGETIIAFATLEGSTASDGEGYNGLFTSKLVQQMKTPQLIESVFKNTRIEVRNASAGKQIPQEWSTLTSNFAFVRNAPPPKGSEPTVGGFVSGKAVYEYGDIVIDTEIGGKLYLNDKYMGEVSANTTENKVQQQLTGNYTLKIVGKDETHTEQVTVYKDRLTKVVVRITKGEGDSFTESVSGAEIEMVFIRGGTFQMGDTFGDDDDDGKTVHRVTVSDFFMGKYEVTQAQWQAVMGSNPSRSSSCDSCPIENVSWNDIQEFLRKLNQMTGKKYRLPTEAEWEYAAKGGVNTHGRASHKYVGSNTIDEVAWYDGNSGSKTQPVGRKKPNELGLYDMSGNVWEWCNDWIGEYSSSSQTNPQGASSGPGRVTRGGGLVSNAGECRSSNRNFNISYHRYSDLGFRLCLRD